MSLGPASTERHAVPGGWIEVAGLSHAGRYRSENQDRIRSRSAPEGAVLLLADGLGGGVGGGEAADAAVNAAAPALQHSGDAAFAVAAATAAVQAVRAGFAGGMVGTTLVAAVLGAEVVQVLNVGDSRAYLCGADGGIRRLTTDHSVPGELVAAGALGEAEARRDPRRNTLTRAVTGDPVRADVVTAEWRSGDTVVLCSDGVWEPLDDPVLARLWTGPDLGSCAVASCQAALDAGSHDNVSVLLARLSGAGAG